MERVDNLSKPLKVGKSYLVPCIWRQNEFEYEAVDIWSSYFESKYAQIVGKTEMLNGELVIKKHKIIPVINHPHSDRENGQKEVHYHTDNRFDSIRSAQGTRLTLSEGDKIIYYPMKCRVLEQSFVTSTLAIKKSKLKHKCIHKGKCPHRGFSLENEIPVNGVITCPLHGLMFNQQTKKLINEIR